MGGQPSSTDRRDFFVSYTAVDSAWAEWLAWQLEAAGFSVVLQAWDFIPGSNFAVEMQNASKNATRTLVVLSPDFLTSKFAESEWAAAFAKDPDGANRKLIPVKVAECEPDGLLGQIVHIDLTKAPTEADARRALLERIRTERLKPSTQPAFPRGPRMFPPRSATGPRTSIRFVHTQITSNALLELVTSTHPYRAAVDATDTTIVRPPEPIYAFLWLPHPDYLKTSILQPFTPVAAVCLPDRVETLRKLRNELGDADLARIHTSPSSLMNEEKERLLRSVARSFDRCFVGAITLPGVILSVGRKTPAMAYQAITNLFLVPLIEAHRRLDVPSIQLHFASVGICDGTVLALAKRTLKATYGNHRQLSSAQVAVEDALVYCSIARLISWCVGSYYNKGNRKWIELLETIFTSET